MASDISFLNLLISNHASKNLNLLLKNPINPAKLQKQVKRLLELGAVPSDEAILSFKTVITTLSSLEEYTYPRSNTVEKSAKIVLKMLEKF